MGSALPAEVHWHRWADARGCRLSCSNLAQRPCAAHLCFLWSFDVCTPHLYASPPWRPTVAVTGSCWAHARRRLALAVLDSQTASYTLRVTARDMTASTFFFLVQSVVAASAQAQCLATAMSGLAPVASVYSGHEPVDAAGTRRFQRAAAPCLTHTLQSAMFQVSTREGAICAQGLAQQRDD